MIYKDDKFISIAEFDDDGNIRFTQEFLDITKSFPGTRKFAAQLITHWGPEFFTMLDYFGPDNEEQDKFSGIDGEPMDCREDIPDLWEYKELAFDGLDAEWYRDIMRSKLVSLKIPEKLIKEYIKMGNKFYSSRH